MTDLSPDQLEQLRVQLETQRDLLLDKARAGLVDELTHEKTGVGDSLDDSTEEELRSTELRLRDREQGLLGKIDGALGRLESGEINLCEDCDEPIGFRRLLARPVSNLCVECKQDQEGVEARASGEPHQRTAGNTSGAWVASSIEEPDT